MIDNTVLGLDATPQDIEGLCAESVVNRFFGVCIRPHMVKTARAALGDNIRKHTVPVYDVKFDEGTGVYLASVIGFPTLAEKTKDVNVMVENLSQYKTLDRQRQVYAAISEGATSIDPVIDLGAMLRGDYHQVEDDVRAVVAAANGAALIKYINENSFLTDVQLALASKIVENAGADCSKSNTGMGAKGADPHQLEVMSMVLSPFMAIKGAGSISTVAEANTAYEAAQRYRPHRFFIGTSKLVNEYR